jgi:hypothetical protein
MNCKRLSSRTGSVVCTMQSSGARATGIKASNNDIQMLFNAVLLLKMPSVMLPYYSDTDDIDNETPL